MPYVGQDLMQFPLARPAQGVLDLAVQEVVRPPPIWWHDQEMLSSVSSVREDRLRELHC